MISKRKCQSLLLLTILTGFNTSQAKDNPFPITFELGAYQGIQGKSQHINIQDLIGDTFTVKRHHDQNILLGAGYILDQNTFDNYTINYGVKAYYFAPTSVSGNVIQENLFNNLAYHYNLSHFPLYFVANSTIAWSAPYTLTFDLGLGANFMRTHSFRERSLDGITLPDNLFANHTTTTFSAMIGAGVRFNNFFCKFPLEIAYRFFYLGEGHFKTNNRTQVLNQFKTGNVYANALVVSTTI